MRCGLGMAQRSTNGPTESDRLSRVWARIAQGRQAAINFRRTADVIRATAIWLSGYPGRHCALKVLWKYFDAPVHSERRKPIPCGFGDANHGDGRRWPILCPRIAPPAIYESLRGRGGFATPLSSLSTPKGRFLASWTMLGRLYRAFPRAPPKLIVGRCTPLSNCCRILMIFCRIPYIGRIRPASCTPKGC